MNNIATVSEIDAAIKGDPHYQWGKVTKSFSATRRGKKFSFAVGDQVGIRMSSNGKVYRFVSKALPLSFVFTFECTPKSKKLFTSHVKWEAKRAASDDEEDDNEAREVDLLRLPKVKIPGSVNWDGLFKILLALGKDVKPGLRSDRYIQKYIDELNDLGYSLNNWYGGGISGNDAEKITYFCQNVFKIAPGKYNIFRGTRLKEKLAVGYVFRLQTTRKFMLQSWSYSSAPALGDFANKHGAYLLRGLIPSKFILATEPLWQDFYGGLKKLESSGRLVALAEKLLSNVAWYPEDKDRDKRGVAKEFAREINAALTDLVTNGGLSHDGEHEVLVDFKSGYKPLTEVLYRTTY